MSSVAAVGAFGFPPRDSVGRSVWLAVGVLSAAVSGVMAWRKRMQMRYTWSGWIGEQAMAEYLACLASQGYSLFHDFPLGKENIDHVVVGPAGVFAIETKCWCKRPGRVKGAKLEAVFDGQVIQFPWGTTTKPLKQAKRITRRLEDFLSKSTGERVVAQPIVALPGWWVSAASRDNSGVRFLSGKQVSGYIACQPAKLSEKVIQQIAYQLDQRCRDLAF